jgi:hypothetical protein
MFPLYFGVRSTLVWEAACRNLVDTSTTLLVRGVHEGRPIHRCAVGARGGNGVAGCSIPTTGSMTTIDATGRVPKLAQIGAKARRSPQENLAEPRNPLSTGRLGIKVNLWSATAHEQEHDWIWLSRRKLRVSMRLESFQNCCKRRGFVLTSFSGRVPDCRRWQQQCQSVGPLFLGSYLENNSAGTTYHTGWRQLRMTRYQEVAQEALHVALGC